MNDPFATWFGLNAPEPETPVSDNWGAEFGCSITAIALTDTLNHGKDIVVGREDRLNLADSASGDHPRGGSVYIFRRSYLESLFTNPPPLDSKLINPVAPENRDPTAPEYQVLRNPFGDLQPLEPLEGEREPMWLDEFGWLVYDAGDVGSPNGGALDGIPDLVVHAQSTDFIGTGSLSAPQVDKVGGLFVYYGRGTSIGNLVTPSYVLLQKPSNLAAQYADPAEEDRIGRAFARLDQWWDPNAQLLKPALLIGTKNATFQGMKNAGMAFLMRLPVPAPADPPYYSATWSNAWGSTPLLEPGGAAADHLFASWFIPLDYWGNQAAEPGQQFVVTSHGSPVGAILEAGKAYSYVPIAPP